MVDESNIIGGGGGGGVIIRIKCTARGNGAGSGWDIGSKSKGHWCIEAMVGVGWKTL